MSDKELIKQEIERRISQFEAKYPKDLGGYWNDEESAAHDCVEEYKRFLLFIDSLPEEPDVKNEDSSNVQKIKKEIERLKHNTPNAYYLSRFMLLEEIESFINSLPEESGCEVNFTTKSDDLEREIGRYTTNCLLGKRNHSTGVYHLTQRNCDDIAHHFAEWQKQQMNDTLQTEYEKGRFDMRDEMMKDAVDAKVIGVGSHEEKDSINAATYSVCEKVPVAKIGDKVKIVIIKED